MKGIILAGGKGTRLSPLTSVVCKQLLPVYNKPMIYYPLSTLLLVGIRDILIITNPNEDLIFKKLFGDGSNLGCKITYAIQEKPNGLAEAFIIGEKFIGKDRVCLILGDNIFYGNNFGQILRDNIKKSLPFVIGIPSKNPSNYGVAKLSANGDLIEIIEKPKDPPSETIIPGIYFYDNEVIKISKTITPSERGELEITSINNYYIKKRKLKIVNFERGVVWFDTGNIDDLMNASEFIKNIELRSNKKIGCIEEIAILKGYINSNDLNHDKFNNSDYYNYLKNFIKYHNIKK